MAEHILTANEKFANAVGHDYGPASDEVQAELLNGFAHSLFVACGGSRAAETQINYIADKLTNEAKKLITELAAFIELQKEATA